MPKHGRAAGRWHDESRQKFQSRRFACAVGAEKSDHLSFVDRETDVSNGSNQRVLTMKQPSYRSQNALALAEDSIFATQIPDFNCCHR